jgi:hypothetical protein
MSISFHDVMDEVTGTQSGISGANVSVEPYGNSQKRSQLSGNCLFMDRLSQRAHGTGNTVLDSRKKI